MLRPGLDVTRPVEAARRHLERFTRLSRMAKDITVYEDRLAGRPALRFAPAQPDPRRVLLYLHGGAYVFGSPRTHRALCSHLARACRATVYALDYRKAPEHPAPAAGEDALRALRAVAERHPDSALVLAGDSAGAGLVLATLFALRDAGQPLPACAYLICPWGDLRLENDSLRRNRANEPLLTRDNLALCAEYYAAGTDLGAPSLSPALGDYRGLPPLYIQAAGNDILLDDARQIAQAAREAGTPVKVEVFADMFHDFQTLPDWLPEARRALMLAGAWIKATAGQA